MDTSLAADQPSTIGERLRQSAQHHAQSLAVLSPGRVPLTYERFYRHITDTVRTLNELGVGRGQRVGIVVPSSAEAGLVQLAVETATCYVSINPALSLAEFTSLLARLKINVVIIGNGLQSGQQTPLCAITSKLKTVYERWH